MKFIKSCKNAFERIINDASKAKIRFICISGCSDIAFSCFLQKTGYAPISKNGAENDTDMQDDSNDPEHEILTEITISAGDKQLDGVLFDNETARPFAEHEEVISINIHGG